MARSKQTNSSNKKDPSSGARKETKEERRIRLIKQAEAREKCTQFVPYVGGVIFLLLLAFALYVRSVPPQIRSESADQQHCGGGGGGDDIPEFMYVDTTPSLAWQAARAATAAAAREAEEAASSETIQL